MPPTPTTDGSSRPDYGLDAPAVVRNLLLSGAIGLAVAAAVALHLIPAVIGFTVAGVRLNFTPASLGLGAGLSLTLTGLWMIWSSKVGKIRNRERLLDRLTWNGGERVLDIGCGRGLMLIGAAERLTTGTATGIDIWRSEDLSGNRPEATLANAAREHVADRVVVQTADMRALPFPDRSFDVVVSCAAIHNLSAATDRAAAIREIARVLAPGGQALIDDIRHLREYQAGFAANGCGAAQRLESPLVSAFWTGLTFGSLRPGTLLVRKTA